MPTVHTSFSLTAPTNLISWPSKEYRDSRIRWGMGYKISNLASMYDSEFCSFPRMLSLVSQIHLQGETPQPPLNTSLKLRVIEPVPFCKHHIRVHSIFLMVPKTNEDWRSILDPKQVNRFVVRNYFCMETLWLITEVLCSKIFITSINLTEACFFILIFAEHCWFFWFAYKQPVLPKHILSLGIYLLGFFQGLCGASDFDQSAGLPNSPLHR